jgi:hypothetical protein
MASLVFNVASERIADNRIDWENDTDIHIMLLAGSGTALKSNATVTAVLAEANLAEVVATDYVRKALASLAVTQSGDKTLFDSASPTWTALGGGTNDTISGWLIYKGVIGSAGDGDSIPIAWIEATSDLTTNGGDVTVNPDSTNKWFYLNNA